MELTYKDIQRIFRKADNWDKLKVWLQETEKHFAEEYNRYSDNRVCRYFKGAKNAIGDTLLKMQKLENELKDSDD